MDRQQTALAAVPRLAAGGGAAARPLPDREPAGGQRARQDWRALIPRADPMIPMLRLAVREDAPAIAGLYRISSGGVADYIWRKLAERGETPLETGARRYAREDTPFSYENCLVAEDADMVVGMINAFPILEASDPAAIAVEDPVLRPYAELEAPNTLYVSGIALLPPYRSQGLGTRMMLAIRERARAERLPAISLIAFAENAGSVRLYQRLGYEVVDRRMVVPHPLVRYRGEALLMVAPV